MIHVGGVSPEAKNENSAKREGHFPIIAAEWTNPQKGETCDLLSTATLIHEPAR